MNEIIHMKYAKMKLTISINTNNVRVESKQIGFGLPNFYPKQKLMYHILIKFWKIISQNMQETVFNFKNIGQDAKTRGFTHVL